MNRNLVGGIYGRSSIKNAHFVPIRLQTWPPQAILVSPSFDSFDKAVLEETILLEINQSETRIVSGGHVC
jgi:hypothetical protein